MLSYRQAFPQAYINPDKPNPFPNHFLVTLDEVRTLLAKQGYRRNKPVPAATSQQIADPGIRTYQLITNTDAAPRDLAGIGCRFTFGRTYCFNEREEEKASPMRDWGAPGEKPWSKHRENLTVAKKATPTHKVMCEALAGGRIKTVLEKTFTTEEDAHAYAATQSAISSATQFGWVEASALAPLDDFSFVALDDLFWCDGTSPTRVTTRPV